MLALFGNLSALELLVIAIVAVMVFGGRLPEVAGRTFAQVRRWRRMLDDLRRESGIDHELYDLHRTMRDVERDVEHASRPRLQSLPRSAGTPPFKADEEPSGETGTEGPADTPPEARTGSDGG